jgi:membrane associated rhomboid family serine protease
MSLRRIKTLYCLAVIAIGVLLAALGGWVGWLAAVLVLSGALPMFRVIGRAEHQQRQQGKEDALTDLVDSLVHQDIPQSGHEARGSQ